MGRKVLKIHGARQIKEVRKMENAGIHSRMG